MTAGAVKILVVDDDEAGRYVKAHILRINGFSVSEAALGRKAMELVASEAPALVLLDVKLPDISGIKVCRKIKSTFPNIVVLQTSAAFTGTSDRTRALDGGADSYLIEPIEPDELIATVNALLRLRKAEQELRRVNENLEMLVAERTRELAEAKHRLELEIADRRKAEAALWHTQKLELVGQLTGGVAHDFNNLLTVIVGNLELIHGALDGRREVPPSTLVQFLQGAQAAAARGAQITQQLLAFARRSVLNVETLCLNDLLAGWERLLQRVLGEAITFEISLAPELWPCRVDPVQFEAAILNLIVNARDAATEGGRVQIGTSNVVIDGSSCEVMPGLAPGAYVCLAVSDTGAGMEPEVIEHAFEPFFTTKEVGKGSGLGLSQVYGFVKQSGGHVSVISIPGSGTTFRLYLPRTAMPREQRVAPSAISGNVPTGSETILIVEDNDVVRAVAVTMIGELGYRVLVAANGPEALDLIRAGQPFDLLFSDIVMPGGINGLDLIREARSMRPGLRALLTSGYADGAAFDGGEFPIVLKPYRLTDLARKIRVALDTRPAPPQGE